MAKKEKTQKEKKEDEELMVKLGKWVEENPEDADVPHIHLTTMKEFTIRDILGQIKEEVESGVAILDPDILEAKTQIKKWVGS